MEEIDSSVFDIFNSNGDAPPQPAEPATAESPASPPAALDAAQVADDVERLTRDFILKRLSEELRQNRFKEFVEGLLHAMGLKTRVSPEAADGVVDFLANKGALDLQTIKVQVKSLSTSSLETDVLALAGKLAKNDYGIVISLGRFTPETHTYTQSRKNFRLIDGNELVGLVLAHYDKLDAKYKAVVPLRKVFVPEKIGG